MQKNELVYYLITYWIESRKKEANDTFTQLEIARTLSASLSTVHAALKPLQKMWAIEKKPRGFKIVNMKKIILYWATIRNIEKDIVLKKRINLLPEEIEKKLPGGTLLTGYSGFKYRFDYVPAEYSEVYVYASKKGIEEIKRRFRFSKGPFNFFVLKKPKVVKEITASLLFVDIWNLPEWYSKDYLKSLEKEMIKSGILE